MSIGRLDRRITLQSPTFSTDSEGRASTTWATVASPWAALDQQSGIETQQAGEELMTLTMTARIRWRASLAISSAMRVLYLGRVFQIVGIANPAESNEWWDLTLREVRSTAG
jgi:SPP1 family predicted phage head-tail adaptor